MVGVVVMRDNSSANTTPISAALGSANSPSNDAAAKSSGAKEMQQEAQRHQSRSGGGIQSPLLSDLTAPLHFEVIRAVVRLRPDRRASPVAAQRARPAIGHRLRLTVPEL